MEDLKSFFRTHPLVSILPLLMLSAGVFYYISRHKSEESSGQAPKNFNFSRPAAPAAKSIPSPAAEEARSLSALDIQGSPEFKKQATRALKLIWLSDRDTFLFIKKYIYIIRNENKTGFYMDAGQPVAAISNAHAFRSAPWCAGIIAHQAFHSYYMFSTKKRKAGRIPPPPGSGSTPSLPIRLMDFDFTSLKTVLSIEAKASEFQIETLKNTGASPLEIKEVAKRRPRDFTTAHDGNYQLVVKQ